MAANVKSNAFFQSLGGAEVNFDYGQITFVTTGLVVEAPTSLGVIQAGFALPESYTGSAAAGGHVALIDRTLSTDPFTSTVTRRASVDSAGIFQYLFIGNRQGTSTQARYAKLQVRGFGEIELQWGDYDFSGTALTVEVPTLLTNVQCAVATLDKHTDSAGTGENVLFCDRTVSAGSGGAAGGAVTMERRVSGGSGDGFNYLFVGGAMSSWPDTDTAGQSVVVEMESRGGEPVYVQFGHDNFSSTDTVLEVSTPLTSIQCVIALPEVYGASAGNGENVMFSDRTVTTVGQNPAVTLARKVGTGSGDGFSYVLIGQK